MSLSWCPCGSSILFELDLEMLVFVEGKNWRNQRKLRLVASGVTRVGMPRLSRANMIL